MFESLIGLVAIIALFVIISRQQSRIGLIERELGALRSLVLSGVVPPAAERKTSWRRRPRSQRQTLPRYRQMRRKHPRKLMPAPARSYRDRGLPAKRR
jgi:uncharacterized membrane protein